MTLTGKDKQMHHQSVGQPLERVETSRLTAFHRWASPMEARLCTPAATLPALDLEMEALDDRVKKLESGSAPDLPPTP